METLTTQALALQRVMLQVSWASQRRLARDLEAHGLTLAQFMALRAAQRAGMEGTTMSALAAAVQQTGGTMTGIVDRLVGRGLLTRAHDSSDRRAYRVALTSEGDCLLAAADEMSRLRLESLLGSFSNLEREQLLGLMQKYLQHLVENPDS